MIAANSIISPFFHHFDSQKMAWIGTPPFPPFSWEYPFSSRSALFLPSPLSSLFLLLRKRKENGEMVKVRRDAGLSNFKMAAKRFWNGERISVNESL
jgi:hypothetical protein